MAATVADAPAPETSGGVAPDGDVGAAWSEAPPPVATPDREFPRWAWEVLAFALALIGPLARVTEIPVNRTWVVVGVISGASLLIAACPARWWAPRLALIATATLGLERMEGPLLALWAGAGLGLADWTIRRRRPLPFVPTPTEAGAIPVTVLLLLAALIGRDTNTGAEPLRFVALAIVVSIIGAWTGDLLPRLASGLGRVTGVVVGRALFFVLGLPLIVIPWLGHRLVRIDPLAWPTPAATRWVPRGRLEVATAHPWSHEAAQGRHSRPHRLRRLVAVPTLILLVAGAVALARNGPPDAPSLPNLSGPPIPAAYEGDDWYPTYVADLGWIMNAGSDVWRPLRAKRIRDVRTDTVNVIDGNRVTWAPPPCDCQRLTVWMYGGSTTFGLGQRDEHTIASELARAAWAEGIALDVTNRGTPGHTHWTEANQMAWDLTIDDPPDLVVFYDGVNELWSVRGVQDERDYEERIEPLSEDLWRGIRNDAPDLGPPDDGSIVDVPALPERTDAEYGAMAVDLYDRSRKMARDTGSANDLPVRWFWQPSRLSRPPIDGEPQLDAEHEAALRELYEAAESRVPDGVGDLTQALDGNDDPLFSDDVHHNEEGATIIATAMFAQLRVDIEALVAGQPVDP